MKKLMALVWVGALAGAVWALDDIALPPGGDFYGVGGTATMTTAGALITSGDLTVNGAVSATGAVDGVPVDTSAGVTSVSTDADTYGQLVKKVVTISGATITLEDSKADGNGIKVLDLQEGAFTLLGALADLTVISNEDAFNASANDLYYISCGTAAGADADADLTSTEADIIPKTTIDTASGVTTTNAFRAILASPAIFDGTSAAKDIYINCAVADACSKSAITNTVSGTLTLYLLKQGDY